MIKYNVGTFVFHIIEAVLSYTCNIIKYKLQIKCI